MKDILRRDIMVVHIKGRVVIICGPVSSGKSSLSRKIASAAPMNMGVVLPYICANKRDALKERLKQQKNIEKALKEGQFLVIKCLGVQLEALYALVISLRIMGYSGYIDIVKMALPKSLHLAFWNGDKEKRRISRDLFRSERQSFKRVLEDEMTMTQINELKVVNPTEKMVFSFEFEL